MQGQCKAEETLVTDSPDVVPAASHSVKKVAECTNIWTRHHQPRAAVPMHRQGDGATAVAMLSHGPDVVAATGNCVEYREATGTGAGDYVPATGLTVCFLHDLEIFDGDVGRRDARERKEYR